MIVRNLLEVIIIFLSTQSKRGEVVAFLEELKMFLEKGDFNIDTDFILIRKNKKDDMEHSTPYTLLDLDYDIEDVVDRLKAFSYTHLDVYKRQVPDLEGYTEIDLSGMMTSGETTSGETAAE